MSGRYKRNARQLLKHKCLVYVAGGAICQKCDTSGLPLSAYHFHHRNPAEKEHNVSALLSANVPFSQLREELEKCKVLCANCHSKVHDPKQRKIDRILEANHVKIA